MPARAALFLALLALPFAGIAPAQGAPAAKAAAPKGMQWVPLEEALRSASATGKYVFVTVYTDWCAYCRKLNNVTFKAEPVLEELHRNFRSVRINAESPKTVVWQGKKMSERDVAGKAWSVTTYPTMLFLNPKGEIIGSYSAYAEPDLMVDLLTYISSGARERNVSFEEYLERKG